MRHCRLGDEYFGLFTLWTGWFPIMFTSAVSNVRFSFAAATLGLPPLLRDNEDALLVEYRSDLDDEHFTKDSIQLMPPAEPTRLSSALALFRCSRILSQVLGALYTALPCLHHRGSTLRPLKWLKDRNGRGQASDWPETYIVDQSGGIDIWKKREKNSCNPGRRIISPKPTLRCVLHTNPDLRSHELWKPPGRKFLERFQYFCPKLRWGRPICIVESITFELMCSLGEQMEV